MKYLLSLCLLFVFGCASNEEKVEPKKYSDDTNRAFEMIERGGTYYLIKAPAKTSPAPQIKAPEPKPLPEQRKVARPAVAPVEQRQKEVIVIDDKINYNEERLPPAEPTPPVAVKRNSAKADERLIEINQNLAFYCMKHRKDPRYGGDEARCMKFVNKTMTDCQKVHQIVNSKLLNCIQTKLRKK